MKSPEIPLRAMRAHFNRQPYRPTNLWPVNEVGILCLDGVHSSEIYHETLDILDSLPTMLSMSSDRGDTPLRLVDLIMSIK